jgi:hypothetical protein
MDHEKFMREAIAEASLAFQKGDVPVVEPSGGGDSRDTGWGSGGVDAEVFSRVKRREKLDKWAYHRGRSPSPA